jgi:hypothetical protein
MKQLEGELEYKTVQHCAPAIRTLMAYIAQLEAKSAPLPGEVVRYEPIVNGDNGVLPHPDGAYVLYSDHEAAVRDLAEVALARVIRERDAFRAALAAASPKGGDGE